MQLPVVRNQGRLRLLISLSLLLFAGTAIGQEPAKADKDVRREVSRYARGDFDHAVKYFDRALASNPHLASAYLNRGKTRQAKRDLDGAISDYEQAMQIDSTVVETNSEIAQAYNLRGARSVRAQRLDDGIGDFTRVINFDPDNEEWFLGRGSALVIKGEFTAALKDLDLAVNLAPVDANVYLIRGIAKMHLYHESGAAKDFEKSLRLSRKPPLLFQLEVLEIESRINEVKRQKPFDRPLICD